MCSSTAPDVFEVHEKMVVKPNANYAANEEEIREAVEECPTKFIKIEED